MKTTYCGVCRKQLVADEVALELASELKKKNITLEVKGAGTVLADNKKIFETSLRISLSHLTSEEDIYEFLRVFDIIWKNFANEI